MTQTIPGNLESELRKLIEQHLEDSGIDDEPGKFTIADVTRALGVGRSAARLRIRKLRDSGRVKETMVHRVDGWGCRARLKGYEFVDGE